ncbi:GNAT family N-acetyltransferase [Streptomyces sp. NEAU-sy36]|uniref:GNAT family N-acetyltransferase n=1 Tax=unclassified Streptomyces TaxID=2593676 RepID=UPI0015D5A23B|nr:MULTISPECIES: GNAT family N-acetyltransferase [unclassified Streptomyces]QLJ03649.1 GNAT family N-acetyltransferase [Streptomyces sp. NEAU-sy36]
MITVRIRQAGAADAASVADLVQEVYRPFTAGFRPTALRWSEEAVRACASSWLMAHTEDELVGVVHQTPDPAGHTLDALSVGAPWRRCGIGTRLVTAVEERALDLGTRRMVVALRDSLGANIEFFTSLGYRPTGPFPPAHHLYVKEIGVRE